MLGCGTFLSVGGVRWWCSQLVFIAGVRVVEFGSNRLTITEATHNGIRGLRPWLRPLANTFENCTSSRTAVTCFHGFHVFLSFFLY